MTELRIQHISFDGEELLIDFTDAQRLRIPLAYFPRLKAATPAQRKNWTLIGSGRGIHWETVAVSAAIHRMKN